MKRIVIILLLLSSVLVVQAQFRYEVTHIDSINTTGSETAVAIVDDSILLYTTMEDPESHHLYLIDFSNSLMQVYQAIVDTTGIPSCGRRCTWGINANGTNSANAAYDAKNDILYFTRSQAGNSSLNSIYYMRRHNGRWGKAQLLEGDVNIKGYTSTHPAVGYLPDGKPILYFSSDRPGGLGGMDIWYAIIIKEGRPGNSTNLGAPVNSDSNEITPFYNSDEQTLYFSSNRTGGRGGFDVYSAKGQRNSWQLPHTLGDQINTPYDDLFFTFQSSRCPQQLADTTEAVEACGFLSSNRHGALFQSDSNCCNDIFRWRRISRPEKQKSNEPIIPPSTSPLDLLPLSLYFHNDEPNPHTLDTTTSLDYTATWLHYIQLIDEYKGAQPSPADKRKWDSVQKAVDFFFQHDIRKGHQDMQTFLQLLYEDLKSGRHVCITINGFASPLFETLYNVNISKRRIDCFRNTLRRWNDEALLPFLNNGSLRIEMVAYGAKDTSQVAPTDPRRDPKSVRSVYSMEAARDRRIDIIDYQYY